LKAQCFEDIIDGYFPLKESLKQMLGRFHSSAAWINFRFSPMINQGNLRPSDPVPLQVDGFRAGLINEASILVISTKGDVILTGIADWSWHGSDREAEPELSPYHRLAEPALVRGCLLNGETEPLLENLENSLSKKRDVDSEALCLVSNTAKDRISIEIRADFGRIARGETLIFTNLSHRKAFTNLQQKSSKIFSIDTCIESNFFAENFLEVMLHDR
tara:strand:+ start:499 stop:1149 length:651 start_codon:yes stop_codon:yes gene_type:complete